MSQNCNEGRTRHARHLCGAAFLLTRIRNSQAECMLVALFKWLHRSCGSERDDAVRCFLRNILRFIRVIKNRTSGRVSDQAARCGGLQQRFHVDGIEGRDDEVAVADYYRIVVYILYRSMVWEGSRRCVFAAKTARFLGGANTCTVSYFGQSVRACTTSLA
jgi:hypothetical protein